MAQKIRHRGPDWSGIYVGGSAILAHERLSIVDPESGGQPLYSPDRKQVLAVNGEIYNHRDIRAKYAGKYNLPDRFRLRGHPCPLQRQRHPFPRRDERHLRFRPL